MLLDEYDERLFGGDEDEVLEDEELEDDADDDDDADDEDEDEFDEDGEDDASWELDAMLDKDDEDLLGDTGPEDEE